MDVLSLFKQKRLEEIYENHQTQTMPTNISRPKPLAALALLCESWGNQPPVGGKLYSPGDLADLNSAGGDTGLCRNGAPGRDVVRLLVLANSGRNTDGVIKDDKWVKKEEGGGLKDGGLEGELMDTLKGGKGFEAVDLEGGFGLDIEGTDGSVKAKRNGVKDGVDGYARVALEGGTKPGGLGDDACENVNGHVVSVSSAAVCILHATWIVHSNIFFLANCLYSLCELSNVLNPRSTPRMRNLPTQGE
jgi:hypothetical protein